MKKLNITKERFEKSRYFNKKYGKLEYVSESGKLFKTNKGQVLKFQDEDFEINESGVLVDYKGKGGDVVIPEGVTIIGEFSFEDANLTNVTIPKSVTSIEENAFAYNENLTNLVIPGNVTSIGNGAFHGCSSLTSVTIGNGVKSIGRCAWSWC